MTNRRTPAEVLAEENGGRPPVQIWGNGGMASSMHPEATAAAVDILKQGGNAADAALALAATLTVTNQDMCTLAGDSAWLVYWARTGELFYLDGYSKVPAAMRPEILEERFGLDFQADPAAYREEPQDIRHTGIVVSTVPGTPAAWAEISQRFGSMPLQRAMARAISLAEKGVPINRYFARRLRTTGVEKLREFESSRKVYFKVDGRVLAEGEMLVQRDLAGTLRRLAAEGHAGFYRGKTAEAIVEYSRARGGVFTMEDFASYQAVWRPVQSTTYRGPQVAVAGPPTSGIHMLQELNILENFDVATLGYHTPESIHVMLEAAKLARADRRGYAGDPDYIRIPVPELLDKGYARERAGLIQMGRARCAVPGVRSEGGDTTHFVVADGEGNVVSTTQTSGHLFGCGEIADGTGLVMNDRTWWLALRDSPNIVAPGRRPNIGHSPTIVLSGGRPYMALGSPGGDGIIQMVMQAIVNVVDYGFDIQDAIEAPRFRSVDLCFEAGMEKRISQTTRDTLREWGHRVTDFPEWTIPDVGAVEGLMVNPETGMILGGYDPRFNSIAGGALRQ